MNCLHPGYIFLTFLIAGAVTGSASGQVVNEAFKILPDDGGPYGRFGSAIAMNNGIRSGSAYVFHVPATCLPDVNNDGLLDPSDFNTWLTAFTTGSAAADQNNDGILDHTDFTAWISNYNAGF